MDGRLTIGLAAWNAQSELIRTTHGGGYPFCHLTELGQVVTLLFFICLLVRARRRWSDPGPRKAQPRALPLREDRAVSI